MESAARDDGEMSGGLRVFEHGTVGSCVIVLHGGPGAAGEATPLAAGLGHWFRVLEPWQRGATPSADADAEAIAAAVPLTVARHVADLHEVVLGCRDERPAVVGHSWGAMLALAYAAAHPDSVGPLVLVGCGTYDVEARAVFRERLRAHGQDFELDPRLPRPVVEFDQQAQRETWGDEMRLQAEGAHPKAFSAIASPVLMVHGDTDPHPGPMIRDSLLPHIPQLEYRELVQCGHDPWLERYAQAEFFEVVSEWLLARIGTRPLGEPT